jgi:hypothetical protein
MSKRGSWLVSVLVLAVVVVPTLSFASPDATGAHAQVKHGRSAPTGWRTAAVAALEPVPPLRTPADSPASPAEDRCASGFFTSPFVPPRSR